MTFTAGNDALASEVNTYLMNQVIQTYASASARNTAIPSPTEGMLTYLDDINQFQGSHGGSVWYPIGGVMPFVHYNHTATQSIANNTETTISSWVLVTSKGMTAVGDYFTQASGTITVVKSGFYLIQGAANFSTNATGIRSLGITAGGASFGRTVAPAYTITGQTLVQNVLQLDLVAGDTINLQVAQSSGGALTLTTNTRIKISYLGA
jgi:hypothetical protein